MQHLLKIFTAFFLFVIPLVQGALSEPRVERPSGLAYAEALYNTLDPLSISEALAFYELHPNSEAGIKALERVRLLMHSSEQGNLSSLGLFLNRLQSEGEPFTLADLELIEKLGENLPNRRLKGYWVSSEKQMLSLDEGEIDLGRALILSQLSQEEDLLFQTRSYSALLDLMALQILARLPNEATLFDKIYETNRFIFDQMHFRFPPQSVYAENIDLYTFLPSVMDNHLGVCLGVTALYLAIAQRIDLPLEIITPPGHIYIRCPMGDKTLNIETTARGVHFPDETYLSVDHSTLQRRSLKEVIGMTHVNQASIYLYKADYSKATKAYQKALPYMPEDPLVKELLGYSYLLTQQMALGKSLLSEIDEPTHTMGEDYLAGKVDLEGMEAVFMLVDDTRESILAKQKRLKSVLEKYPEFRDGLHQLAITWIQLNRYGEAIETLLKSYLLDPEDITTAYYLALLFAQRHDFKNGWFYLKKAENLAKKKAFCPSALKELRRELIQQCPEA